MFGIIGIENLHISCIIGACPEERLVEQEIIIDLRVETSFQECSTSDKVTDTISYVDLSNICTGVAKKGQYCLLETLVVDLLEVLMAQFKINWAWIRVKKKNAIPSADYAFVEMKRVHPLRKEI